jgi:tetratricopeptide (TPR) repeat protein
MRYIVCLLVFLSGHFLQAQVPQLVTPNQPDVVKLSRLGIDVKIIGSRAITLYTLTFHNTTDRILEGELSLPLPEGVSVNRYALDINGKMREAVPVEKQKATQVFESIERRKIDPGLLEKTEGNVFRTRVYPLPAKGERSIIIGYEQELVFNAKQQLVYHLPFEYKQAIKQFSLNVTAASGSVQPIVESVPVQPFSLNQQKEYYRASVRKDDFISVSPLTIAFTKNSEQPEVYVQRQNGQNYFYVQTFIPSSTKDKVAPKKLSVIWDVSLSGLYRNVNQEISLLEQYLQQYPHAVVDLFTINNTYKKIGTYTIANNETKALIDTIKSFKYDGGTNFSKIEIPSADEHLFFTDGFNALSTADLSSIPSPVYTITTATKADYATLHLIAQKTGGVFINLLQQPTTAALELLTKQPLRFLGIKKNKTIVQTYPSIPVSVGNSFSIAGITTTEHNNITMQFGYGNKVAFEKTVSLHVNEYDSPNWNLAKLWAQKKVTELETTYEANKDLITELGKEYSIVTKNTSLMVLEEVEDYVRYRIEPPAELATEYKQLIQAERNEITQIQRNNLESAIEYSGELWTWWNTHYPVKKKKVVKPIPVSVNYSSVQIVKDEEVTTPITQDEIKTVEKEVTTETIRSNNLQEVVVTGLSGRAAGVSVSTSTNANIRLRGASSSNNNTPLYIVDGKMATILPDQKDIETIEVLDAKASVQLYGAKAINGAILISTKGAIQNSTLDTTADSEPDIIVYAKESQEAYLKQLSKAASSKRYATYLDLRDKNLLNPTFYFEVANFFIKQNDKATGLQILTNLAELDLENHELYKTFSYKLKELKQLDIAEHISRKVVQWRPQEPQSYRDHALILLERQKYQAALDTLYLAISKDYHDDIMENYAGIEETIIMELNNLAVQHKDLLNTKAINKKLIHAMPVDVRVVLNWNMNDTDIDLWITDPKGEKCYYSNNRTAIGGRLSEDFTDGYGPEQFLLKKAVKGKYKIQVHFYGQDNPKIAGKTTLQAEIYTNYGRPNQQRKLITLQLGEEEREGIYIGEFSF